MVSEAIFSLFFDANAELGEALTEHWSLTGDYSAVFDLPYDGALVVTATRDKPFVQGEFGQFIDLPSSPSNEA